jgi:hypothetical protein
LMRAHRALGDELPDISRDRIGAGHHVAPLIEGLSLIEGPREPELPAVYFGFFDIE